MRQYQKEQDEIVSSLKTVETLLLHSCCGPCSSYCLETLSKHFYVTVLWFNPNIQPADEYALRLENQRKITRELKCEHPVSLIELDYDPEKYFDFVRGFENEPEGGARCEKCFAMRLDVCAREAKMRNFDWFTTTLTVSPHKSAPLINEIGEIAAKKYSVRFLPSDFKKKNGYKRSIELSRQFDLYRQNYCGCIFSKEKNS